jgi:hypothetical protein
MREAEFYAPKGGGYGRIFMIIFREKSVDPTRPIRTPKEAVEIFDFIKFRFARINTNLSALRLIFLSSEWYLKESYEDSMRIYSETLELIRIDLDNIGKAITTLRKFLLSETRPIPLSRNTPDRINEFIKDIERKITRYKKEVRGKLFPMPSDEIKRCKIDIQNINILISEVNRINAVHHVIAVGMVRDLKV